MAALGSMLREDRERFGLSVARASWLLGVKPAELLRFESGERAPAWETWDRICKLFGWGQTFEVSWLATE